MTILKSPRDYNVPHDEWRPNQQEFFAHTLQSESKYIFGELAVGSGKSAVSTALGTDKPILVHTHTLALLDQYEREYDFTIIKGRQEYLCILPEKVAEWKTKHGLVPTAIDCHFPSMHDCDYAYECPYMVQKLKAVSARRAACTYRYGASSQLMKDRKGRVVFDEAHSSAEELINFAKFTIAYKTISRYVLPDFPVSAYGENNQGAILIPQVFSMIIDWLCDCLDELNSYVSLSEDYDPEYSRVQKLKSRFSQMVQRLEMTEWFLHIGDERITLHALSSKFVAQAIFRNKSQALLVSGTIGEASGLADELGIDDFEALAYPHPIPVHKRLVFNLKHERMTFRNLNKYPTLYRDQALKIFDWISRFANSAHRGIIVTSSFYKIKQLAQFLVPLFPDRRFIIQNGELGVSKVVNKFVTDVHPGDIAIGSVQGWSTGIDLRGDLGRFVIVAGVPHVNPNDKYAQARRQIQGGIKYQNWHTFNTIMQAVGRVTRGAIDENGEVYSNYGAIVDGSALTPTSRKYYSSWFKESII